MISKYVESAATFSPDVDGLVILIAWVVGFWGLLAEVVLLALVFKFSAQEGRKALYVSGEDPKEKRWVSWPHFATLFFDVLIIVAALRVWREVKLTMPQTDETVRIIAQQWAWTFVHPGPDGKLDTPDDIRTVDELHVERGKTYRYELESRDVLHSFSVPVFRLKQDAVPGRVIQGWFAPTLTGQFDIQCVEICGIGHALMPARIIIEDHDGHQAWLAHPGATAVIARASSPTPGATP